MKRFDELNFSELTADDVITLVRQEYTEKALRDLQTAYAPYDVDSTVSRYIAKRVQAFKKKTREYSIVTYSDKAEIVADLVEVLSPEHYAYIYHDQDNKKEHWHILVTFESPRYLGVIQKTVDDFGGGMVEPVRNLYSAYHYLYHDTKDAKDKFQYNPSLIVSDCDWWTSLKSKSSDDGDSTYQCLEDMLSQKYSTRQLAKKYGRDFIFHYDNYKSMASRIAYEENLDFCTLEDAAHRIEFLESLVFNQNAVVSPLESQKKYEENIF